MEGESQEFDVHVLVTDAIKRLDERWARKLATAEARNKQENDQLKQKAGKADELQVEVNELRKRDGLIEALQQESEQKTVKIDELQSELDVLRGRDLERPIAAAGARQDDYPVSWDRHQHILDKYNGVMKELEKTKVLLAHSNTQGGNYRRALDYYKEKFDLYRNKLETSKKQVANWQEYTDQCRVKSATKSRASSTDVSGPLTPYPSREPLTSFRLRLNARETLDPLREITAQEFVGEPFSPLSREINQEDAIGADQAPMAYGSPRKQARHTHPPQSHVLVPDQRASSPAKSAMGKAEPESTATRSIAHIRRRTRAQDDATDRPAHMAETSSNEESSSSATIVPDRPNDKFPENAQEVIPTAPSIEPHATIEPPPLVSTQSTVSEVETIRENSIPPVQTHYRLVDSDNDEPVVVSVRTLKRKRGGSEIVQHLNGRTNTTSYDNDEVSTTELGIKEEDRNESQSVSTVRRLQREQSIEDLDILPGRVYTPRKIRLQRLRSKSHGRHRATTGFPASLHQLRSSSLPPEPDTGHPLTTSSQLQLERSSQLLSNRQSAPADIQLPLKHEAQEAFVLADQDDDADMLDFSSTSVDPRVLRPLNANQRKVLPTTSSKTPARKPRREPHSSKINDLAEVEESGHRRRKGLLESVPSGKTPRLQNMLETPSTKPVLLSPMSGHAKSHGANGPVDMEAHVDAKRSARRRRKPILEVADTFEDEEEEARPKQQRSLRKQSMSSLCKDDFKINPEYNQGLDYAFAEVVRNQEQRKCMRGCTRPDCCGASFRKVVELGGALPGPGPGLWESSQEDSNADQRLLEQYLGADARSRLHKMTSKEKTDMLMRAKADQLAQKHGRHRMAWTRGASPPGFWRADFPSTQEQEKDRQQQRELERLEVEERYHDAMRGGGRWLFRDE